MANGDGTITWARIVSLVLGLIGATQMVVIWSIQQIGDDRYRGSDAKRDQATWSVELGRLRDEDRRQDERIKQCESFIRQHRYERNDK